MKINGAVCHIACDLKRFSIECRETKTKVTQKANQKKGENLYSQWEHKVIVIKRPEAWESADDHFVINFSFASDWLKRVTQVFWTNHGARLSNNNANTKQSRIIVNTKLKIGECDYFSFLCMPVRLPNHAFWLKIRLFLNMLLRLESLLDLNVKEQN